MRSKFYQPNETEFWDWTWSDMGTYDIPAQVDFILKFTNQSKLAISGHSQGTTQIIALLCENPSFSQKLSIYVALAPVAYVNHITSPLLHFLSGLGDQDLYSILGQKAFEVDNVVHFILPDFCKLYPNLCTYSVDAVCGPTEYWNASRVPFYLDYEPNPTSVKDMIHWTQMVRQQKFQRYDYGSAEKNLLHYNQTTPPQYNLTNYPATLPTAFFVGGKDYFADPTDISLLLSEISFPPFVHSQPDYAHLDPLLGYKSYLQIYPLIVQLLERYSQPIAI